MRIRGIIAFLLRGCMAIISRNIPFVQVQLGDRDLCSFLEGL